MLEERNVAGIENVVLDLEESGKREAEDCLKMWYGSEE